MQRTLARSAVFIFALICLASAAPAHAQSAPANFAAVSVSASQINLSWNVVSGTNITYSIYRGTTSGGENLTTPIVSMLPAATTTYSNTTGLISSTPYFYQIAAVSGTGPHGTLSPEREAVTSPTGVQATAGDSSVALTWSGGAAGVTYNVYRAVSGGSYSQVTTGLTTASYLDTTVSLVNETAYTYEITAVANGIESAKSLPTAAVTPVLQINAGGPALTSSGATAPTGTLAIWGADNGSPSPGGTLVKSNTITNVPSGVPYQVFQSQRQSDNSPLSQGGTGFSFTETSVANGNYTLTLYFAETGNSITMPGQRQFNVFINGTQVLANFDIYRAAGGKNAAVSERFPVTVTGGQFSIVCQDMVGKSLLAAFALSPPASPAADIPPPGWGGDVVPSDGGTGAEGAGPASALGVSLPSLTEEDHPGPDLSVYNPLGPSVAYERMYRGNLAVSGYGSPGLCPGWTDAYDLFITPVVSNMVLTGYALHYPNGAVDTWTGTSGTLTTPSGAPYIATLVNSGTITMQFKDHSVYTFIQKTMASAHNYAANTYLLTKITNIVSHFVTLNRSASAADDYHIVSFTNDGGTILAQINYDTNNHLSAIQDVASMTTSEKREVDYKFSGTTGLLTDTSFVLAIQPMNTPYNTAYDQWHYTYQSIASVYRLNAVAAPDPQAPMPGKLGPAATITLGTTGVMTGLVAAQTDSNGAKRTYTSLTGGTQVAVYNPKATTALQQWSQMALTGTGGKNADAGMQDGSGNRSTTAYTSPGGSYVGSPSPYLPSLSVDRNGHPLYLTYDTSNAFGNVLTMTDNRGTKTTLTYDPTFPLGQVKMSQESYSMVDKNGMTVSGQKIPTTFDYFSNGLLMDVNTPEPDNVDDNFTVKTTYAYTGLGNVKYVIAPGNDTYATVTTNFGYATPEAVGEPTSVSDYAGDTTHYLYDGRGNCTAMIDASNNETDTTYNLADQVQTVFYPKTTGSSGAFVNYIYQYLGGPVTSVALYPEGTAYPPMSATPDRMTSYTYDHEGQVLTVSDLGGTVATYTYDGLGRVATMADGNGMTTKYVYDVDGNLSQMQYPRATATASGSYDTETYTYDPDQNVTSRVDGRGVTTTYVRDDPESLVTGVSYTLPATPPAGVANILPVNYQYDGFGRLSQMQDGTGTKVYAYDDLDLLRSLTVDFFVPGTSNPGPQNQIFEYVHNPDGSVYDLSTPLESQINVGQLYHYTYDAAQRVTQVTFPWSGSGNQEFGLAAYEYQPNGWIKAVHLAYTDPGYDDIVDIAPAFNARGFLTDLTTNYADTQFGNEASQDPLVSEFSSKNAGNYDSSGNRKSLSVTLPLQTNNLDQQSPFRGEVFDASRTLAYTYDGRDELTLDQGMISGQDTTDNYHINHSYPFVYDPAYNATTFRGMGTNSFTNDEQIQSYYGVVNMVPDTSLGTFTFDGDGSPTTYQNQSLVFDPEDRLLSVMGATFTYDGDGRRATKTVGGVTTYFLYDGDRLLEEETDPSGTSQVTTAYGWGVDGLRARYAAEAQGNYISRNTSFGYLYDPSGNVAARLEFYLGGSYVGARDYQVYDGFGSLTGHWDAVAVVGDQRQDLASVGFGGQAGYYTDQETGLVLLGARYYDPSTGRFLNRDPIGYGGGINLYGFCGNNPVNESDPEGTSDDALTGLMQGLVAAENGVKIGVAATKLEGDALLLSAEATELSLEVSGDAVTDNIPAIFLATARYKANVSEYILKAHEYQAYVESLDLASRPHVLPKLRTYNQPVIPGYDKHHMSPPLGGSRIGYNTAVTVDIRNDNQGGRVSGGLNLHTASGGFQTGFAQFFRSKGYTTSQYNNLPNDQREVLVRSYWASLGVPYPH